MATQTDCVHYWIIAPHLIGTSPSVCKLCGDSKELSNVLYPMKFIPRSVLKATEDYHAAEKKTYITAK